MTPVKYGWINPTWFSITNKIPFFACLDLFICTLFLFLWIYILFFQYIFYRNMVGVNRGLPHSNFETFHFTPLKIYKNALDYPYKIFEYSHFTFFKICLICKIFDWIIIIFLSFSSLDILTTVPKIYRLLKFIRTYFRDCN